MRPPPLTKVRRRRLRFNRGYATFQDKSAPTSSGAHAGALSDPYVIIERRHGLRDPRGLLNDWVISGGDFAI